MFSRRVLSWTRGSFASYTLDDCFGHALQQLRFRGDGRLSGKVVQWKKNSSPPSTTNQTKAPVLDVSPSVVKEKKSCTSLSQEEHLVSTPSSQEVKTLGNEDKNQQALKAKREFDQLIQGGSVEREKFGRGVALQVVPDIMSVLPSQTGSSEEDNPSSTEEHPSFYLSDYLYELAYRSSYAREKLKEKIKEPSMEIALRQLRDFFTLYRFHPSEMEELNKSDDVEKLELLFDYFGKWYFKVKAPSTVKMEQPWEWFPRARSMRRKVFFHCGPTNSGKTHQALEALMKAKSGVYCAPLKALASQVWKKINDEVPCDLVIGDERIFGGAAEHISCTMEMTPVDMAVEVGVIDEIQLIESPDRGWAWTRALLGLPAKELHICGEERTLHIIKRLLYQTKELKNLKIIPHRRLVPLALSPPLMSNLSGLQNGDCLVAFSRKQVFGYKQEIEEKCPGAQVSMIYGGLPFSCREAEAAGFNQGVQQTSDCLRKDASGQSVKLAKKHILVSTDAIAYGLNMNIRRIVFSTLRKFNGKEKVPLDSSTVLQVGGRAGRFGLEFGKLGFCAAFHQEDNKAVEKAFQETLPRVEKAGLLPTADILSVYAELHNSANLTFSQLMAKFIGEASNTELFRVCDMSRSLLKIAKEIDSIPNLTLKDKIIFCFVPLSDSSPESLQLLKTWAMMHAECTVPHTEEVEDKDESGCVKLLLDEKFKRLENLRRGRQPVPNLLRDYESLYKMVEVYCWLSWRFVRTFKSLEEGKALKESIVKVISLGMGDSATRNRGSDGRGGNFFHHRVKELPQYSTHAEIQRSKWLYR